MNIPEYRALVLRELPLTTDQRMCDTPERAAEFWRLHIQHSPRFTPGVENFAVLLLNTRRRITGFQVPRRPTRT